MDRTERFYKITQLLESRRVVPLSTLIEDLGARLEEARNIDGRMTLMVFEIECCNCGDAEIWAHAFQKGYLALVQSGRFGRNTDFICAREPSQIVLLGAVKQAHVDALRRRLAEQVESTYRAVDPDLEVSVHAACAAAPDDGADAESLLEEVLTRLVAERRIAA